jgi:plastocyanin
MKAPKAIAILVSLAALAAAPATASQAPSRAPARMLVYAQEWSLWPSRTSLPPGKVIVQLWNRGQDAHDLRIRKLDAGGRMTGPTQGVQITQAGGLSESRWELKPGRYMLYCSMPGHFKRGMHVRLVVR